MKKKTTIPMKQIRERLMKKPGVRREYEAQKPEFDMSVALFEARSDAGLTQVEVAERMQTSQGVVARLEAGRSKPTMRTLEKFAAATGHRVKFSFERVRGS